LTAGPRHHKAKIPIWSTERSVALFRHPAMLRPNFK
jgi:hypothetical protein